MKKLIALLVSATLMGSVAYAADENTATTGTTGNETANAQQLADNQTSDQNMAIKKAEDRAGENKDGVVKHHCKKHHCKKHHHHKHHKKMMEENKDMSMNGSPTTTDTAGNPEAAPSTN